MTASTVREGRAWRQDAAPTCAHPCIPGTGATAAADSTSETTIAALWAAAWTLLCASFPDAEGRLAQLPHAGKVARLEASAARRGARVIRGEIALSEFASRLREWSTSAADALTKQDQALSLRTCGDCGSPDTDTHATGLTGVRACSHCLKETTP
jgi:hypothetical protein